MTRDDVLEHLCQTVSMVYHTIGNYTQPSDGFCRKCPVQTEDWHFAHSGWTLVYIRNAVRAQLIADGFTPAEESEED